MGINWRKLARAPWYIIAVSMEMQCDCRGRSCAGPASTVPLDAKPMASTMSCRVPTMDPLMVMRFSTMSKIEQGKSPTVE